MAPILAMTPVKSELFKGNVVVGLQRVEILLIQGPGAPISLVADFEETGLLNVVKIVHSAEDALACLRGTEAVVALEPALVLVDLVGSGNTMGLALDLEFLAEIKSDLILRTIPVVVLTENPAEADVLNAYSHGACSFVSLPKSSNERRKLIRRFAQYWSQVAQLPKTVDRTSDEPWVEEIRNSDTTASNDSHPIEILVVDDNNDDVLLLREAFGESVLVDFVKTVEDGNEALRYLRREGKYAQARQPSLILLDINMPQKNGFEILAEIRADTQLRNIPVVMLTTSKHESDILRAYSIGACSFISKPVNFEKMRQIAQRFTLYWTQVADLPRSFNEDGEST